MRKSKRQKVGEKTPTIGKIYFVSLIICVGYSIDGISGKRPRVDIDVGQMEV